MFFNSALISLKSLTTLITFSVIISMFIPINKNNHQISFPSEIMTDLKNLYFAVPHALVIILKWYIIN